MSTLSEAIRVGAQLLPQQMMVAFFETQKGEVVASSTWGAAYHATFGLTTAWMGTADLWYKLGKAFPEIAGNVCILDCLLDAMKTRHSTTGLVGPVEFVIDLLEKREHWTRQEIADWLDTHDILGWDKLGRPVLLAKANALVGDWQAERHVVTEVSRRNLKNRQTLCLR